MASQRPNFQTNTPPKVPKKKQKFARKIRNRKNSSPRPTSQLIPQPFGDPSQFNWFWQNYHRALEWQGRHQVAYWKSRSLALEYENNLLHQHLQSLAFNDVSKIQHPPLSTLTTAARFTKFNPGEYAHYSANINDDASPEEESEETELEEDGEFQFEFQVTEEMMDFFEQSIRHKLELKKQREKEKKEAKDEATDSDDVHLPPKKQVGVVRSREMKLLYGKAAPMILGMETAMQLSFNRNCDMKQPKLWPNIPLRL